MKLSLRKYQQQGVSSIRLEYMERRNRVLYVLPTGGGKTVIFCYIAEQAAMKGNRICILVHRQELVSQTSEALDRLGVSHGVISAGHSMDLSHGVQVASVWTLARRLHQVPADFFQLLIVDEAHHAVAGSWAKVINHYRAAKVLGVTATPERLDGKGLGQYFDSMIVGPDSAWLTANGFLAPARVFAPPTKVDTSKLHVRGGDYRMEEAEDLMMQAGIMGDAVAHFRRHIDPGTAIAFCCTIAHAQAVADAFKGAGYRAAALDGNMDKETRRALIAKLGTGEVQVLTSCQIISEGTDVPSVTGAILLRPTQSLSLYLQQVGRCLRPAPGKTHAIINDHVGNSLKHGLPSDPREWSLEGRVKRQATAAPPVKVCPGCFAAIPTASRICPECGHQFEVEAPELTQIDGDLVERTFKVGEAVEWLRAGKWSSGWIVRRIVEGNALLAPVSDPLSRGTEWASTVQLRYPLKKERANAKSLEDLQRIAAQRGYKPGWAEHVWQSRAQRQSHARPGFQ
jgi:superfamily II DNA or RNA helicase